jgi:hypothetical protein
MKWNRATVILSTVILVGLVLSAGLKNRVLASPQAPAIMAQSKAPAKTAKSNDPSVVGQWAAPVQLGIVPIHATLLYNSQVLFWQYYQNPTTMAWTTTAVQFNPVTGAVTDISIPTTPPFPDFFCAGNTQQYDGSVLIAGGLVGATGMGDIGSPSAVMYAPGAGTAVGTLTQEPNMMYARYYPTDISMPPTTTNLGTSGSPAPDGYQFVVSGQDATGAIVNQPEAWNPAANNGSGAWAEFATSAGLPKWTEPWNNYPRMFLLPLATGYGPNMEIPAGSLYIANQLYHTWFFVPGTLSGGNGGSWTFIGQYNEVNRFRGAQVLMPDMKTVMVMGGQAPGAIPTLTTETINLSSSTPAWTYNTPMATPRHDLNAVQLPDGTILGVGGAAGAGDYTSPVYAAELFTPSKTGGLGAWTTLASQLGSRGYHSVALLLPNGTVLSAGSDSSTQYQTYAEIFSPPYLFKGARPVISSNPATINYGDVFTVGTSQASSIGSVALIKLDTLTHADHMDQRMLNLTFTAGGGGLHVTAPANANYAPPGYYMVFIVTTTGIPSVAKIVQVAVPTANAKQ